MADDFDAAGMSWWSTARTAPSSSSTTATRFDGSSAMAAAAASASCSAAIADPGSIDQQPAASGPLLDSSLQISGYGMDWNQSFIRSSVSAGRGAEPSFHAMLQESFSYPSMDPGHPRQPHHIGSEQFLLDHQQQQVQQQQQQQQPALSMMLQGLFEPPPEAKPQQPIFNYQNPSSVAVSSHFLTSPPTKQQQQQQLQFSNSAAFWNASVGAASDARSGFYPSALPVQFSTATAPSYEHKPSSSSLTTSKSNSDTVHKKSSGSSSSSEPAMKKSRVEAPSPLPTFKVRKEKLGDRITALQQLVSPFGKTDTASVLHEAILYIKFLHDQVSTLSTPYLKNGHPMQQQQSSDKSKEGEGARQDLRSRGLCLVPIESTYPVASETTADFWTPTFGGSYR